MLRYSLVIQMIGFFSFLSGLYLVTSAPPLTSFIGTQKPAKENNLIEQSFHGAFHPIELRLVTSGKHFQVISESISQSTRKELGRHNHYLVFETNVKCQNKALFVVKYNGFSERSLARRAAEQDGNNSPSNFPGTAMSVLFLDGEDRVFPLLEVPVRALLGAEANPDLPECPDLFLKIKLPSTHSASESDKIVKLKFHARMDRFLVEKVN